MKSQYTQIIKIERIQNERWYKQVLIIHETNEFKRKIEC